MPSPPHLRGRENDGALLSTSTILILSGFLVGLTVGCEVGEDLSPFVLSSGLAGFVAYLGLDIVATRRREEALAAEQRQMERRLDKHVQSLSAIGLELGDGGTPPPLSPAREASPRPQPAGKQPLGLQMSRM